jgi:metal-responsive CopG/Arc/MetJ family transcriptional regulator
VDNYKHYIEESGMKTIQMTMDEDLLRMVDQATEKLNVTRSAFIREALEQILKRMKAQELEEKHREGYRKHPIKRREFDVWEKEQVWS